MNRHRYLARTLLIAVAVIVAYFPLAKLYHLWFTSEYSSYYVTSLLASEIHNGDSVDEVATHFASQRFLTASEIDVMKDIPDTFGGTERPMEDGDTYYCFSTYSGESIFAQFRDGRLVGLPNECYEDLPLLAEINGFSLPNPIFRFGFWPLYLIGIICIWLFLVSRCWIRRPGSSGQSLAV
ncbi:hypothetical protein FF011L_09620 [Roseimaritima multifibrata]|uniref:Uncharacterized protein n=1 Tax=Roseimaritima multifibrata TaxID=1930274 RepID=A0A517MBI5_9BACT|nr:hypothetical protein [Roseimaritima multifibrata]QDS92225.1 hypothetical protein FF011L_09620 [Roseimaritima multifibrata]